MLKVSAPGKCILLGEHAVVYGHPALAVSIDMRLEINIKKLSSKSEYHMIEGKEIKRNHHPHIFDAINEIWGSDRQKLAFEIREGNSNICRPWIIGCCAISTISMGLITLKNEKIDLEKISSIAHKLEADSQGGLASPMDSSTSTHGGCILLANEKLREKLATILGFGQQKNGKFIHLNYIKISRTLRL